MKAAVKQCKRSQFNHCDFGPGCDDTQWNLNRGSRTLPTVTRLSQAAWLAVHPTRRRLTATPSGDSVLFVPYTIVLLSTTEYPARSTTLRTMIQVRLGARTIMMFRLSSGGSLRGVMSVTRDRQH
jgi:hypothetical protein